MKISLSHGDKITRRDTFSLAGMTWETGCQYQSKGYLRKKGTGISVIDWNVEFESELTPSGQENAEYLKGKDDSLSQRSEGKG
jgi:hypothetical protein